MSLSAAKSRVLQARTQIETGRLDDVEPTLAAAEGFLANLDPLDAAYAPAVHAQIAEIRAEMAGVLMPDQRTLLSAAEGTLRQAVDQRRMGLGRADIEVTLKQAAEFLAGVPDQHAVSARAELSAQLTLLNPPGTAVPPAAETLPVPAAAAGLPTAASAAAPGETLNAAGTVGTKAAGGTTYGAAAVGGVADGGSAVGEVANGGAAVGGVGVGGGGGGAVGVGGGGGGAVGVGGAAGRRVSGRVEDDDAEVDAVRLRADVGEAAVDALVADWRARSQAQAVQDAWLVLLDDIDDWADESDNVAERPLEEPRLPKTREAVQRMRHFVHADPGDSAPAVRAVYREAAETLERAGAKLDAAFNAMLDDAERRPVPSRGPELDRPLHLATAARYTFEGTRFLDANVARAEALHERWQAEVAAVMAAQRELYDDLAREAEQRWPAVVAGHAPQPFTAHAEPGTKILLARVHNRAGWDFDGNVYPFSLRYDGVVLAGLYEGHVLEALEHAWYELKLDVNDRIPWDVVAVVEGPGTVGERTVISVKDLSTGLEIGKREEWPPVPCVRLRIVALHAGPVVT